MNPCIHQFFKVTDLKSSRDVDADVGVAVVCALCFQQRDLWFKGGVIIDNRFRKNNNDPRIL